MSEIPTYCIVLALQIPIIATTNKARSQHSSMSVNEKHLSSHTVCVLFFTFSVQVSVWSRGVIYCTCSLCKQIKCACVERVNSLKTQNQMGSRLHSKYYPWLLFWPVHSGYLGVQHRFGLNCINTNPTPVDVLHWSAVPNLILGFFFFISSFLSGLHSAKK